DRVGGAAVARAGRGARWAHGPVWRRSVRRETKARLRQPPGLAIVHELGRAPALQHEVMPPACPASAVGRWDQRLLAGDAGQDVRSPRAQYLEYAVTLSAPQLVLAGTKAEPAMQGQAAAVLRGDRRSSTQARSRARVPHRVEVARALGQPRAVEGKCEAALAIGRR